MDDQTEARRLEKTNLTSTPKTREHFTDWRTRCDTSAMLSVDSLSLITQENPLILCVLPDTNEMVFYEFQH